MKRKLLLLAICATSLTPVVYGQLNYLPSGTSNFLGTYTDLAATGTVISTTGFHNTNSAAQNIGFTFNFNGQAFTQFILNSNGFIKLGSTPPTDSLHYLGGNATNGGVINSSKPADINIISALNHELYAGVGTAEYRMLTAGTAPNRTCTIQFKNVHDSTDAATPTPLASQYDDMQFQIILYETSNMIDLVYGSWTTSIGASALKTSGVGLKGSDSTNINLLLVSKPSTGLWSSATFIAGNYVTNTFNFGNPPTRATPDAGRTFRFKAASPSDAAVAGLWTLGTLPIPFGAPRVDSAIIRNLGMSAFTNLQVTLTISGATTFTNTQTIASLPVGGYATVGFASYLPPTTGVNSVMVSIPVDSNNTNNMMMQNQTVSDSVYSYSVGNIMSNSVGTNNGYFFTKYQCFGTGYVNAAKIYISNNDTGTIHKGLYAIVLDSAGNRLDSSAIYTITAADTGKWHRFSFPHAPGVSNSKFFVGLAQPGGGYFPLGYETEGAPVRNGCYYTARMAATLNLRDGGGINSVRPRRYMIQAVLGKDTGILELAENDNLVSAYPNPSSDFCTFSIKMDRVNDLTFTLFDVSGKVVRTATNIRTPEFRMERGNLAPGVYMYKFNDSSKMVGFGKLIIE